MNTLEQVNATPPYATYADGSALRAVARDLVAETSSGFEALYAKSGPSSMLLPTNIGTNRVRRACIDGQGRKTRLRRTTSTTAARDYPRHQEMTLVASRAVMSIDRRQERISRCVGNSVELDLALRNRFLQWITLHGGYLYRILRRMESRISQRRFGEAHTRNWSTPAESLTPR
ncbi:uncharacterized protein ATNIH1004_004210 [Aspergillus tanneri]|uniref:Uncharacterized protein n=1 Tax=Aspergillus tanneri TaxID=1220188 RepID=A0A5M9MMR4_9EURO|nr:uncharacterized protein ATNIH1004_004210 [Aspergillus tanneri]KAA8648325.1 hypothetical protein ATNIH1004_004210 [Aspergillus tanneri]